MIDHEAIAVAILDAAGYTVGAEIPTTDPTSFVRVSAAGGPATSSNAPDWLMPADVQFDIWAETKEAARDVAGAVRSSMLAAPRNPDPPDFDPPAVVTSTTMTGPSYEPDEDWPTEMGRPRPRYVMLGSVTAHPKE